MKPSAEIMRVQIRRVRRQWSLEATEFGVGSSRDADKSQRDMRSILSKAAALYSTNAMYNVRLCSLHFSVICRRAISGQWLSARA